MTFEEVGYVRVFFLVPHSVMAVSPYKSCASCSVRFQWGATYCAYCGKKLHEVQE